MVKLRFRLGLVTERQILYTLSIYIIITAFPGEMEHAGDRGIRGRNADNDHADSLSTEKGDLKCDDRKLSVETVLVDSDWTASLRGPTSYFPRPLAVPIYASSTYRLENAREGGVLASTHATVSR